MIALLALAADLVSYGTRYQASGPLRRPAASRLVWDEEFAGSRLDGRQWTFDTSRNKAGWYNGEKQYYAAGRAQNLRIENGRLVIESRSERLDPKAYPDWGGQSYTSAKIVSRPAWRYGFFEIKAQLPCARGTWPAIWMLPKGLKSWPEDGEIDIMEQVGSEPNKIYATLHSERYNHAKGTQRGAQKILPTSCTRPHRYQLDWQPDAITIGIDGQAIMRVRRQPGDGKPEWPYDRPFQLILNLAIGGDWAGAKGIDDGAMPQRMTVDYVKVWQVPEQERPSARR